MRRPGEDEVYTGFRRHVLAGRVVVLFTYPIYSDLAQQSRVSTSTRKPLRLHVSHVTCARFADPSSFVVSVFSRSR